MNIRERGYKGNTRVVDMRVREMREMREDNYVHNRTAIKEDKE